MAKKPAALLLGAVCLSLMLVATGNSFDFSKLENSVAERTLENGLKVIVLERHDAPVASFVTRANVGSVDDPKGNTGMAHMFEHMAFKGTTTLGTKDIEEELKLIAVEDSVFMELRTERLKGRFTDTARVTELTEAYEAAREAAYELVNPNSFSETISREGGVGLNAFTSFDETVYHFSLPSNKMELWMAMESERFLNPVLRQMYKERDVITEERRMGIESSPMGRMYEELINQAYTVHPYHVLVIGAMSDINNYTRKEARAFFEKYYGPSNLTISIVGDVKTDEVFKMAEKYWGRIPYRPAPERVATIEPEQKGERRTVLEDPSQPVYVAGWHVPEVTHPDRPAIEAMLDYFGQGRTSPLYANLVKENKYAIAVSAEVAWAGKYPTLAIAFAMPSQGHTNDECETEIMAELQKVKDELISPEAMEQIRARANAGFINGLTSNMGLAMQLTHYQQFWGDWRAMFRELDRINAVTPEDIQRVAQTYFTTKNRTVVQTITEES